MRSLSVLFGSFLGKFSSFALIGAAMIVFLLPNWSNAGTEPVQKVAVGGDDSSGGGSNTALPDQFTGEMSYQVPIEVPAGRNGMDPGIALRYRSNSGNGWIGVGWDLELGSIQRAVKNGVNYSGDSYQFKTSNSTSDIVNVGNGEYLALVESRFSRIRILTASDGHPYWEITDKNGVRFLFGQSTASRQDDPGNASRIFKWCLDRIEDPNGNYTTIVYTKDQGQIYLNRIDYTGNIATSSPTTNYVKFYLESRPDAPVSFTTNFNVKTAYRLKTIDVNANGNRTKAYNLLYLTSNSSGRSILANVQPFGKDVALDANGLITNAGTASNLPPFSFTANNGSNSIQETTLTTSAPNWGTSAFTWSGDFVGDGRKAIATASGGTIWVKRWVGNSFVEEVWATNVPAWGAAGYTWVGDFNGDGKVDIATAVGGTIYVMLSTGSSFNVQVWTTTAANWGPGGFTWVGDFNGDGKADIATASGGTIWVKRSTGSSFVEEVWATTASNWGTPEYTRVGDFNGDGKMDIATFSGGNIWVKRSTGSSFVEEVWATTASNWGYSYFTWVGDFNGDGKADIATAYGGTIWVKLSTGASFIEQVWTTTAPNWGVAGYTRIGDFNGDGMTDIIAVSAGTTWVKRSTGSSFVEEVWPTTGSNWGYGDYVFADDCSGDGKTDIMSGYGGTVWLKQSASFPVDLITQISNGIGGTTTIGYTPSTKYTNTQLPFPVQTVSSITTNDGNGHVSTTNYTYSGGYFHIGERDFRGFNYAKVTGPVGPNGEQNITETWFHQGNDTGVDVNNPNVSIGYMKGRPYRTRVTDASSNKYSETTTSYTPDTNGAPYFNPPYQVDSYTYDGDTSYTQARTVYTYDGYGNVVREDQYGDVNDSTDDRTIVRTFSPNDSNWIVGLPASEDIYEGIGTVNKVAGKVYYYDDLTACNGTPTNNQTPIYGKLTRVVSWLNGGTSPEVRMAYDTFGNLVCQSDAKGNTMTIAYDGNNTFPTVVTNPFGHQAVTQYYGVGGVPADKGLYGQPKSVTDPNNATTATEYDLLGRKTKVTLPDGTWTSQSYNNFGTVGSQNVRTDTSAGLWKAGYFDGLGRTIKEKSSGPDQKTIARDTVYNITSTVKQTSLPYFDGLETPRYLTYIYDPMGRVTRENHPDSTFNLACYNDGVTAKVDANGHRRREVRDASGRLVKIQEYTGNFSTCATDEGTPYATTLYSYDVLGNLRFVTDAKGNQTEIRYDSLGRKYYMNDPDMGVWGYGYDANGNLTSQTDAKQQTVAFAYDGLNRLTNKNYPSGTNVVLTYDESTSTYAKGRLTKMTDGSGITVYNYDSVGRTTGVARTIGGLPYNPLSFAYVNGRLDRITYPDNDYVDYRYDLGGNFASVGSYVSYGGYDSLGRPATTSYGNGVMASSSYDGVTKRLNNLSVVSPSQGQLLNTSYGYDNVGNVSGIADSLDSTRSQTFVYDELNRLKQSSNAAYGTLSYNYDQIGNLLAKEGVSYTYGARPHAVASLSNGRIFTYDTNGNIVSDGQRNITYDYDNMPTVVGNVSFTYDGNGTRVGKTNQNNVTTVYLDKLFECTNGYCDKHIFAGDTRIAIKTATQTFYHHGDHLGSTAIVTDNAGNKVESIAYYPFGSTRSDDTSVYLDYKYTGQEQDRETGLYNYNARLYDPDLGKFLTPDSIVPDPENPQSLNRYSYVINNPLNLTDPTGHEGVWQAIVKFFTEGGEDQEPNNGSSNPWANFNTGGCTNCGGPPPPTTVSTGPQNNGTSASKSGGGGNASSASVSNYAGSGVSTYFQNLAISSTQSQYGEISAPSGLGRRTLDYFNTDLHSLMGNGPQSKTDIVMKYLPLAISGGEAWFSNLAIAKAPVVIGETMSRVEIAAARIPGAKILNNMPDFKAMGYNSDKVTSLMMQYNRKWVLDQLRSGRTIIDIGRDVNRPIPSIFYQMEQNMLKYYNILHP